MKKMSKLVLIILIILTIIIMVSYNFFDKKDNIDKILESQDYSYLPVEAKQYLKAVYEETGEILLTEKNKQENVPYLNPQYVEYLVMEEDKKNNSDLIPSSTIIDYVYSAEVNENIELEEYYNLSAIDTNDDGVADKNYTSPMKDQGSLGICWAYATIETAETHLMNLNEESYTEGVTQTFTVRQLDYAFSNSGIKNYNNRYGKHALGTGGNFRDASKILADGLSLFDTTWKYNDLTTTEQLELSEVLNDYYSLYELNSSIEMPSFAPIVSNSLEIDNVDLHTVYINTIKQFIKTYGGAYVGTYAPGCSCSAINYHDPENYIIDVDSNCTKDMAHAMQIIGWDDNYKYKYCSGTTHTMYSSSCSAENVIEGKGAWILRNSWGSASKNKYTYLTYDSMEAEYNFITELSSMENKNWDYIYNTENENLQITRTNEGSTKIYTLSFNTDFNTSSNLTKIKFRNRIQETEYQLYYSETGLEKDYVLLDTFTVEYPGYYTYDFSNYDLILNNETKIKLLTDKDILDEYFSILNFSVFTKEKTNNQYIITKDKIYEQSNDILENGLYKVYLYSDTYNIDSNSEVSYKLYDSENNDITNKMTLKNNIIASNRINSILYLPELAENDYFMIETIYNDSVKSISKITAEVPKPAIGSGTQEDPYVIMTPQELYLINYNMDAYYVLGNDIDMTYDTQNENGNYYNFGNGWTAIGYENLTEFTGSLDGHYNGTYHKIIGLNLTENGLFYKIRSNDKDINIKNLIFEKAIIKNGNLLANTIEGTAQNKVNIENVAAMDCQFYEQSNVLSANIISYGPESVTINNIFSNSTLNESPSGDVISNLALTVDAKASSSVNISNIQLLGKLNNKESIYTSAIFRFGYGNINLNNIILNNYSEYDPYLFARLSKTGNYYTSINNLYYLNAIKKTAFSDAVYEENNVVSKTIAGLKDSNNYLTWENFNDNWIIKTMDGIKRIPILKFVPFEYTSIKDININKGDTVNLYDYITPNIEAAHNISFEIADETIATIDEDGSINALKYGTTSIHVTSYYDGYEKEVPLNVINTQELVVNFNRNGGNGTMINQTFTYNISQSLNLNTFTREGYTFKEWNTKEDGTGTSYIDGSIISLTKDITLYAIWEINNYTITFNSNGGTGTMNNQTCPYETLRNINLNTFTREGYTFKEWNTKEDGTGTSYTDEKEIKLRENLTLYAIWVESYSYIINKYSYDDNKKYIDKIDINTTIDDFKKNIDLNTDYSIDVEYKNIDDKKMLYTGSKTKIYNNSNLIIEYTNIIRGEVTGDGKINYLDYVNVYNHIQKVKHPESTKKELKNEYLISADMSGDGKVNYLDYVKIYNKIKELKGGN